jgi:hypothetical protein
VKSSSYEAPRHYVFPSLNKDRHYRTSFVVQLLCIINSKRGADSEPSDRSSHQVNLLLILSRVLVTSDAGLDWRFDLLDIQQAELKLIITLSILL